MTPPTVHCGDCLDIMATMPEASVDAIVTDPPYGLSFMGKAWDHGVPGAPFWAEALRVAKPGAHLLAFGGTRTFHRLAVAIEDAGWEIRDCIMWVYGSGFPKSLDVSKAIDKAAGAEREVQGKAKGARNGNGKNNDYGSYGSADDGQYALTAPATDAAKQWAGWGTALKPAWEPIIVARKPLQGTVAANVQAFGTGAINVDGCRVGVEKRTWNGMSSKQPDVGTFRDDAWIPKNIENSAVGRWPANLIHDGSEEVVGLFPETGASSTNPDRFTKTNKFKGTTFAADAYSLQMKSGQVAVYDDTGSAARFFYTAKASGSDRGNESWDALPLFGEPVGEWRNEHPTVKPLALMRYLCKLVTPPGGLVLDPFMGSGSTLVAAQSLGFSAIGIDIEERYCEIAAKRLAQDVLPFTAEPNRVFGEFVYCQACRVTVPVLLADQAQSGAFTCHGCLSVDTRETEA